MSNMSNMARDTVKEAKDAARETGNGARGGAVWRKAKSNVGGVVSDVQDKGMEAVGAVREVGDNVVDAIDESLKKRPYTTLALAVGIGFLFGATWRR